MTGIQFVTDKKGRKTAVLIDLKKHGTLWEDFWDGLVSESRRRENDSLREIPNHPAVLIASRRMERR